MQQLLGDRPGVTDGSFLKELFLQRLPYNVRMVLASTPESTSLEKLAEMADKIMEVATPSVATVSAPSGDTRPPPTPDVDQLRADINRLEKLVNTLVTRSRPRTPSQRRSHRSPTPPSNVHAETLCWYHQKYGSRAQRFRSPCSWSSNEQASH